MKPSFLRQQLVHVYPRNSEHYQTLPPLSHKASLVFHQCLHHTCCGVEISRVNVISMNSKQTPVIILSTFRTGVSLFHLRIIFPIPPAVALRHLQQRRWLKTPAHSANDLQTQIYLGANESINDFNDIDEVIKTCILFSSRFRRLHATYLAPLAVDASPCNSKSR